MAADISTLMSALSGWEIAGYAGLGVVLIGVIGEAIHEFMRRFSSIWWLTNGGRLSALVLISGLAIEGVAQIKANSISGQIIALLGDEAAAATQRTAELNKKAEADRLERVKIEQEMLRQLRWRNDVTKDDFDLVVAALKARKDELTGLTIVSLPFDVDPEADAFSSLVMKAISEAKIWPFRHEALSAKELTMTEVNIDGWSVPRTNGIIVFQADGSHACEIVISAFGNLSGINLYPVCWGLPKDKGAAPWLFIMSKPPPFATFIPRYNQPESCPVVPRPWEPR